MSTPKEQAIVATAELHSQFAQKVAPLAAAIEDESVHIMGLETEDQLAYFSAEAPPRRQPMIYGKVSRETVRPVSRVLRSSPVLTRPLLNV